MKSRLGRPVLTGPLKHEIAAIGPTRSRGLRLVLPLDHGGRSGIRRFFREELAYASGRFQRNSTQSWGKSTSMRPDGRSTACSRPTGGGGFGPARRRLSRPMHRPSGPSQPTCLVHLPSSGHSPSPAGRPYFAEEPRGLRRLRPPAGGAGRMLRSFHPAKWIGAASAPPGKSLSLRETYGSTPLDRAARTGRRRRPGADALDRRPPLRLGRPNRWNY